MKCQNQTKLQIKTVQCDGLKAMHGHLITVKLHYNGLLGTTLKGPLYPNYATEKFTDHKEDGTLKCLFSFTCRQTVFNRHNCLPHPCSDRLFTEGRRWLVIRVIQPH